MNNDNHGHRLTGKLKPPNCLDYGIRFFRLSLWNYKKGDNCAKK